MKFNPSKPDSMSINIYKVANTRHSYFVFVLLFLRPSFVLYFRTSESVFFSEIVFKDITMKTRTEVKLNRQL